MKGVVYNLEFPSEIDEISVGGYRFVKLPDYEQRYEKLCRFIGMNHLPPTTGENVVTAQLLCTGQEPDATLRVHDGKKAIEDIILLLTLFTGRNVFWLDQEPGSNGVILADARKHMFNSVLVLSMIGHEKWETTSQHPCRNIGFEKWLNTVYDLIRSQQWLRAYDHGHLLAMIHNAYRTQDIFSAYKQCFSLIEHLYSITFSQDAHAIDKLCNVLQKHYWSNGFSQSEKDNIRVFVKIRNSLVHDGKLPEIAEVHKFLRLFIELTEAVVASCLGARPSETLDTNTKLAALLAGQEQPPYSIEEGLAKRGLKPR